MKNILTGQQEIYMWLKVVELSFVTSETRLCVWLYKIEGTFCTIVKERILSWRKKWDIKHILCSAAVLILQWLLARRLIKPQSPHILSCLMSWESEWAFWQMDSCLHLVSMEYLYQGENTMDCDGFTGFDGIRESYKGEHSQQLPVFSFFPSHWWKCPSC